MRRFPKRVSEGFTLVEVLISTAIFLLATTAILSALLMFLRAHYSYSQTAYFNSDVRVNYERLMQELRNADLRAGGLPTPTEREFTIYTHAIDAADTTKTVRYYQEGSAGNMRLMRMEGGHAAEVFSGLADFSFRYYTTSEALDVDETRDPSSAAAVRAVKLVITPKDRSPMLFGKDTDAITSGGKNLNITVRLRN